LSTVLRKTGKKTYFFPMTDLKSQIIPEKLPKHIAIIMDGNGRWAQIQGKARIFGHTSAIQAVRETTEGAAEIGIQYLTLYAFSTENWARPKFEVNALMNLLVETLSRELDTLHKNNIRLQAIGDIEGLPEYTKKALLNGIEKTKDYNRMTLILALNYSSKWEILEATKLIATEVKNGVLIPDEIDEHVFQQALCTHGIPNPELLIRTSGEYRLSNFLLWQIAYTELYFTPLYWPDFRKTDLFNAILDFQKRERRFGLTSEQQALNNTPIQPH